MPTLEPLDALRIERDTRLAEQDMVNNPPLMPIRRWMRQIDRSMPSEPSASRHARTW